MQSRRWERPSHQCCVSPLSQVDNGRLRSSAKSSTQDFACVRSRLCWSQNRPFNWQFLYYFGHLVKPLVLLLSTDLMEEEVVEAADIVADLGKLYSFCTCVAVCMYRWCQHCYSICGNQKINTRLLGSSPTLQRLAIRSAAALRMVSIILDLALLLWVVKLWRQHGDSATMMSFDCQSLSS